MPERGSAGPIGGSPVRITFTAELDQIRLQVEVMALLVGQALDRMRVVLSTGDTEVAELALSADDAIDAMLVSLTERCYDLLRRQSPVGSDLRFIVSVLRILEELERIGDLALRVVKQAPALPRHPQVHQTVNDMAVVAESLYRTAVRAWSTQDLDLACTLAIRDRAMDSHYAALLSQLLELKGPGAAPLAIAAVLIGRALDRIADHTVIVAERLRYMLTANPTYLASEVR